MRTVWKFPIDLEALDKGTSSATIKAPYGARFLSAAMQHGELCLWADVEDAAMKTWRTVYVVGTGQPGVLPDSAQFVATVLCFDDSLVLHVWVDTAQYLAEPVQ